MSTGTGTGKLAISDIIVIILYFALVLAVGLWMSTKNRGSVGGYFLAGRNMGWIPLGASLFASNVGSLHFVGLAGSGAEAGIGIAVYELNAIFVVILLGWLFVPVYIASGIFTMPEYIRKRFGGQRIRVYLAVLSLLLYIFTKISADLYAGALFIEQALNWNIYGAIVFLLAIAALFTITAIESVVTLKLSENFLKQGTETFYPGFRSWINVSLGQGGLTAVIWTDFIQTCIMVVGALGLMFLGFSEVGGMEGLRYSYEHAVPNTTFAGNDSCGYPREDYFNLMRDPKTGDVPWPGIIGLTINSIWYWCADQVIVQRTLAAKNYSNAKGGTMLCGYLKILPLFILVFPGMMARVLYPDEVACVDKDICTEVCGSPAGCSNIAYPLLVLNLLPNGARGIMLAVMLSALMSSLTSIFNSSSTIFTIDIWKKIRKAASDVEMLIVGRLCVLVLVVVSILWIPIIQASQGSQLFVYIQTVSSFLQPPICAVYLLAIFWKRTNEPGAFWGLMAGLLVGSIRFVLEFSFPPPLCIDGEEDDRPNIIKNFHYLYFAIFLFLLTGAVTIAISLFTAEIDDAHLHRLTYWSRHDKEEREDIDQGSVLDQEGVIEQKKQKLSEEEYSDLPFYKKTGYWVCGIEEVIKEKPEIPEEVRKQIEDSQISIEETSAWKKVTNINAIILCTAAIFIWGFFA